MPAPQRLDLRHHGLDLTRFDVGDVYRHAAVELNQLFAQHRRAQVARYPGQRALSDQRSPCWQGAERARHSQARHHVAHDDVNDRSRQPKLAGPVPLRLIGPRAMSSSMLASMPASTWLACLGRF